MVFQPNYFLCKAVILTSKRGVLKSLTMAKRASSCDATINRKMRAIQCDSFGGIDVLNLKEDVTIPSLNPGQVLVRVAYFGINPVDTYIREGQFTRLPDLPYILGSDASGFIEEIGDEVNDDLQLHVGQRVFVTARHSGSYAEYLVTDANYVFPLDEKLTLAQGAALGVPYFTAFRALMLNAKMKPGDLVLVHGASGAVGTAACQIAQAYKAGLVVGTAGTQEGMGIVSKCGASKVFCHRTKGYEKELMAATEDQGYDVIIENLANTNLGHDLQILRKNGRVMIVGCRGTVTINPRLMMMPETSVMGVALFASTVEEYRLMGGALVEGMRAGWVGPIIDHEYDLAEVKKAHHEIIHSKGAKGKLVVKVANE